MNTKDKEKYLHFFLIFVFVTAPINFLLLQLNEDSLTFIGRTAKINYYLEELYYPIICCILFVPYFFIDLFKKDKKK